MNPIDYDVSFTFKYYGYSQLSQAKALGIWLLRWTQIKEFWVPNMASKYWDLINVPGLFAKRIAEDEKFYMASKCAGADALVCAAEKSEERVKL